MPYKCGIQVLSWARGTAEQPHTRASWAWEITEAQEGTRHSQTLQQQLPLPQEAQKTGPCRTSDTAWEQVTVGQSNSLASKGVNTGLQKCFKHSLHPESVCGRQLRTRMRVSCDKHGHPPLPPTKSQTCLSEGKAQSFVCSWPSCSSLSTPGM